MQRFTTSLAAILYAVAVLAGVGQSLAADTKPGIDGPWRYTMRRPPDGWESSTFDDSSWTEGNGGFGTAMTPGSRVATEWTTNNIWLRRTIEIQPVPARPALLIHHDEDAEVYLNGRRVAAFKGYVTEYQVVPLDEQGKQALVAGKNLLAIHCRQTGGGQFIDVHVVDQDKVPKLPAPQRSTVPFKSELITQWGERVTPENVWQEYPRPALVRDNWQNLNGMWDYAVTPYDGQRPEKWDGEILVPFCPESKLSGVQRLINPDEALWYQRTIEIQHKPAQRVLLNFEAVDYQCRVWVNDKEVGEHVGGNTAFQFDITEALREGSNTLVLRVEDATGGAQLRGKQRLDPQGIWYTRVTGIWQTVWLEQAPARRIDQLKITTSAKNGSITVKPQLVGTAGRGEALRISVTDGDRVVAEHRGAVEGATLALREPKLWSPDSPHLYGLRVALIDGQGNVVDQVESYAGVRDVGRVQDADGNWRFTLNGKILFHWGPLDQGWWPDGLLTPPSDEGMLYDIKFLQDAGFNMIRKHIKVEPRRYYYHCDRMGMLLWQDQVSGGSNPPWTRLQPDPVDAKWSDADHAQFMREFEAMISQLENHPSIVVWVPFNEAWGQHRTTEVGEWTIDRDPTRLVNIASGGNFWPVGHVVDEHRYPHPGFPFDPPRYRDFVKVMGEFGGHGWPVPGHLWDNSKRNWGYGGLPQTMDEYVGRYRESIRLLTELKSQGIAAGVYTQTTDVEGEINGLMTYDRKVIKIPAKQLLEIHQPLLK